MIEPFYEAFEVAMEDGTVMEAVFLWSVPHMNGVPWWHMPDNAAQARREWCGHVLGEDQHDPRWMVLPFRTLFISMEDAVMYDLAWS